MDSVVMEDCPFCRIAHGDLDRQVIRSYPSAVVFTPRDPVTPGHTLVVPRAHIQDIAHLTAEDPVDVASLFDAVAQEAARWYECNVITSRGLAATQTVFHLHIHIVPRRPDDGLKLPWTGQERPWTGRLASMHIRTEPEPTCKCGSVHKGTRGSDHAETCPMYLPHPHQMGR